MIIKNQVKFKKAQELISKIIDMVERGEGALNIMRQNLSAVRFLKKGQKSLMENYVASCFNSGIMTKEEKRKEVMTKEILKVLKLFNR